MFEKREDYEAYSLKRNVSDWLAKPPVGGIALTEPQDLLSNSLENWMLWDPRIQPDEARKTGKEHFLKSELLLRALLDACGKRDAIDSGKDMLWSSMEGLLHDDIGKEFGTKTKHGARMLPFMPAGNAEACLFKCKFSWTSPIASKAVDDDDAGDESEKTLKAELVPLWGAVLGSTREFLNRQFSAGDIRSLNIDRETKEDLLRSLGTSSKSARALLAENGWQSLKEWYCQNLHTKEASDWEAWWAVKDDEDYFNPLRLGWNGASVLTLDLLLIGTRKKDGVEPRDREVKWQGAAISNLSFDRTECTVQLVAKRDDLLKIGDVVNGLCKGQGGRDHGKWSEWPHSLSGIAPVENAKAATTTE